MPDVVIYADTFRSPELRHEVPLGVPDPFLYVERDGTRHVVVGSMEIPRLAELGAVELHPLEEFGLDELRGAGSRPRRSSTRSLCARSRARRHAGGRARGSRCCSPTGCVQGDRADRRRRALRRPPARRRRRPSSRGSAAPRPPPRPGWRRRATCCAGARTSGDALTVDGEPLTVRADQGGDRAGVRSSTARPADEFIVSHGAAVARSATTWARARCESRRCRS